MHCHLWQQYTDISDNRTLHLSKFNLERKHMKTDTSQVMNVDCLFYHTIDYIADDWHSP